MSADNPLLEHHELPPFEAIRAEHIVPAIETILADSRAVIAELEQITDPTWDNTVGVLEAMDDRLAHAWSPVGHLHGVADSEALREAYNACLPKLSAFHTEVGQNAALFRAYRTIREGSGFNALEPAQQKIIENALRDFRLSGVDLPSAEQQRFAEIRSRLSELSAKFSENLLDATQAWTRNVTDESELAGLPDTALGLARQLAEAKELDGWLLTLDFPIYLPVQQYCDNRALREEMHVAFTTRASDQGPNAGQYDNGPIMTEILALRQEMSALLGFGNFAEYSLATKMADTPGEVISFLEELARRSKPAAEREFAALSEYAATHHGVGELAPWDVNYFGEKLRMARYDVSQEALRPYFPATRTILGMFEVAQRLYDVSIAQVDGWQTWHPDVRCYEVSKGGERIARFYLDAYAREHKQGGAWMDDCRVRRKTESGLQIPVAYLTCNFTAPVGDADALLTHDEVVTLFHEFGHGLHHMLTKVSYSDVSGINGVAWDAVELPSQFMENWCWESEALAFLSSHFETGESLPDALLEKMLAAKNFQSGMLTVRQLEFALFDFRLHMDADPAAEGRIQAVLNDVRSEVTVVPQSATNRFQHSFGHIFGGGYAAGYYSYKWAEVLSADAFARFREEGIFNRQTGERFLEEVLEVGGSVDAMDMFVAFRGRKPDLEALLTQDGIA